MLFWFSPRRLALLTAALFTLVIVLLRKTSYDDLLSSNHGPKLSIGHNGKGRPTNGIIDTPNGPRLQDLEGEHNKVFEQSHVETLDGQPSTSHANPINGKPSPLPHDTYENIQSRIHKLRAHWAPPAFSNHYPPYANYGGADYDPNLWESFDWDHDFYIRNGIKRLGKQKPYAAMLVPYLPYPDYNTPVWREEWLGTYVACEGARGKLLNESKDDWLMAYSTLPDGFPEPAVGDATAIGIDINHCFDRYHRLGPYGYGQNSRSKNQSWNRPMITPNWTNVPWGRLHDQCLLSNRDRYKSGAREPIDLMQRTSTMNLTHSSSHTRVDTVSSPRHHHRTALLVRTWASYEYTENDLENLRSLITELSLLSGGEYQVFLFVNIKNSRVDLDDPATRQRLLEQHVPHEFHSISILWNEIFLEQMYPKVGDWQVYWHQFMPLQWFSKMFPQFDFVWNWEMDARYTGNHYHFLEQVSAFAKAAPRKYLWERNQRFYFPAAHESYVKWLADTHMSIEAAMKNDSTKAIWGPLAYNRTYQTPIGPTPPCSIASDTYEWGVGEEADLITLQPIWDPTHTSWVYKDKIFNFLPGIRPQFSPRDPLDKLFTHPDFVNIPRRTYINTVSRFSKRQLDAMHLENQAGRTMQAEMWPATAALHHGLKAVYAPHPIWTDRKWPGWYMDAVFNSHGQEHARWGARSDSVYNSDREHNFAGWSWYYNADFPRILYRRWLGWPANIGPEEQYPDHPLRVLGGSEFEDKGMTVEFPAKSDGTFGSSPGENMKMKVGGQGRMCLPPMLLHPVKKTSEPEAVKNNIDYHDRMSRAWRWLMNKFD